MKSLLLLAALLGGTAPAFCQASWRYQVAFALNDKNGKPLRDYDFTTGKCQLFIRDKYADATVFYVPALELFYVTGGAVYPGLALGLVSGQDSTIVGVPAGSERVLLANWPTEPGTYSLQVNEDGSLKYPEAVSATPVRFRQGDERLLALTVLDWRAYRDKPSRRRGEFKSFFQRQLTVQSRE